MALRIDVTAKAVKVIRAVGEVFGRRFDLEMLPWGADHYLKTGISVPPNGHAMLRDQFDAIFIGALRDPRIPDMRHARDILLGTRFELDLYVNHRPVKLFDARTKKNRKLRLFKEHYPNIPIKLFYGKDYKALLAKYGLRPHCDAEESEHHESGGTTPPTENTV